MLIKSLFASVEIIVTAYLTALACYYDIYIAPLDVLHNNKHKIVNINISIVSLCLHH